FLLDVRLHARGETGADVAGQSQSQELARGRLDEPGQRLLTADRGSEHVRLDLWLLAALADPPLRAASDEIRGELLGLRSLVGRHGLPRTRRRRVGERGSRKTGPENNEGESESAGDW